MQGPRSPQPTLRTVDVGRRAGYSVQQIRVLEREGVLPPAERSAAGYRLHTERHVGAARAYKALAAGVGPVEAKRLVRAAHTDPVDLLARVDEAHARLHEERRDLAAAREAAGVIAAEPMDEPRPTDS